MSTFMKEVIAFYKIEVVHLLPSLIMMSVILAHLCKAFLGVIPDLDLFYLFYVLKKLEKLAVSRASLCLENKSTELYI